MGVSWWVRRTSPWSKVPDGVADVVLDEVGVEAMAAAEPAPAAVMTWARGSTMFPADPDAGDAGAPGGVGADPAVVVDVAAEADEQGVVGDEAGRHEQGVAGDDAAVGHLHPAQLVVVVDDAS